MTNGASPDVYFKLKDRRWENAKSQVNTGVALYGLDSAGVLRQGKLTYVRKGCVLIGTENASTQQLRELLQDISEEVLLKDIPAK